LLNNKVTILTRQLIKMVLSHLTNDSGKRCNVKEIIIRYKGLSKIEQTLLNTMPVLCEISA